MDFNNNKQLINDLSELNLKTFNYTITDKSEKYFSSINVVERILNLFIIKNKTKHSSFIIKSSR